MSQRGNDATGAGEGGGNARRRRRRDDEEDDQLQAERRLFPRLAEKVTPLGLGCYTAGVDPATGERTGRDANEVHLGTIGMTLEGFRNCAVHAALTPESKQVASLATATAIRNMEPHQLELGVLPVGERGKLNIVRVIEFPTIVKVGTVAARADGGAPAVTSSLVRFYGFGERLRTICANDMDLPPSPRIPFFFNTPVAEIWRAHEDWLLVVAKADLRENDRKRERRERYDDDRSDAPLLLPVGTPSGLSLPPLPAPPMHLLLDDLYFLVGSYELELNRTEGTFCLTEWSEEIPTLLSLTAREGLPRLVRSDGDGSGGMEMGDFFSWIDPEVGVCLWGRWLRVGAKRERER